MQTFAWIIERLLTGYLYAMIAFLLLTIFSQTCRNRAAAFFNQANAALLIVLLLNVLLQWQLAFRCRSGLSENTDGWFNTGNVITFDCFYYFIWTLVFGFVFQLCFLFAKNRIKRSLTLISIGLLLILTNSERVIIFITSLYRDYQPASWATYYPYSYWLWNLSFAVIFFLFCLLVPPFGKKRLKV